MPMPRFAANLKFLFTELPLVERFAAARDAGFRAVEYQFPYDEYLPGLVERLHTAGLEMVLINAPPGDWAAGERGLAVLPGRQGEFQASVGRAIECARALAAPQIHFMAGIPPEGAGRDDVMMLYAENLRFAAEACRREQIAALIEPLNATDVPGYFLVGSSMARATLAVVGHSNLYLQYDIYHGLMNGETPRDAIAANLDVIRHMQVAGFPGRHEPMTGDTVDFRELFEFIDTAGYAGWIGCEYAPADGTVAGLGWAEVYGIGGW